MQYITDVLFLMANTIIKYSIYPILLVKMTGIIDMFRFNIYLDAHKIDLILHNEVPLI